MTLGRGMGTVFFVNTPRASKGRVSQGNIWGARNRQHVHKTFSRSAPCSVQGFFHIRCSHRARFPLDRSPLMGPWISRCDLYQGGSMTDRGSSHFDPAPDEALALLRRYEHARHRRHAWEFALAGVLRLCPAAAFRSLRGTDLGGQTQQQVV